MEELHAAIVAHLRAQRRQLAATGARDERILDRCRGLIRQMVRAA